MPRKVIKKDGREEEFIPEKIVVSAVKSGAPPELAREIAREIQATRQETMESKEIRERVLEKLRAVNPVYEHNWRSYDKAAKRLYDRYKGGLYS
ncbi:MAG TPA: ATPase [Thermoplasmatales archaeon]|nr:ATP cone domain-containing protein [Candidatus Thermoplasmatota archaeon]MDD5778835.1 ATP cone domain-containing protein [Candidatus Thermoplasmatota archaeon]HDS59423.1 ATPase [Thermoplasmatales archaeon]